MDNNIMLWVRFRVTHAKTLKSSVAVELELTCAE